tara:strand:- start:43 stop:861 length:819 start_codon:yes stop_codon:yes gene_type:complete
MPTAIPFTALGRGNGFPFCVTRVDVSSFDFWVTLGGYAKTSSGNVTPEQINNSRINAMKLFWNVNSLTVASTLGSIGYLAGGSGYSSTRTFNFKNGDYDSLRWFGEGAANQENKEPFERVCINSFDAEYDLDSREVDAGGVPQTGINSGATLNVFVRAMYNGVVTDPDNFIGYGASNLVFIETIVSTDQYRGRLLLSHYLNDQSFPNELTNKIELVTFAGMPFYASFEDDLNWWGDDVTFTNTDNEVKVEVSSNPPVYGGTLTMSNLDFYTY